MVGFFFMVLTNASTGVPNWKLSESDFEWYGTSVGKMEPGKVVFDGTTVDKTFSRSGSFADPQLHTSRVPVHRVTPRWEDRAVGAMPR